MMVKKCSRCVHAEKTNIPGKIFCKIYDGYCSINGSCLAIREKRSKTTEFSQVKQKQETDIKARVDEKKCLEAKIGGQRKIKNIIGKVVTIYCCQDCSLYTRIDDNGNIVCIHTGERIPVSGFLKNCKLNQV